MLGICILCNSVFKNLGRLGNPAPHVYLIKTSVKGTVAIYAGPGTGATITGKGGSVSNTTKKLYLPASAYTCRVYRVKGPFTVGN
ncbi:hypothetical protein ACFW0C_00715 [Aerococcus sp. NPDC058936]|uniref:hypothetical protein n=1 Tax=Aerococcus sp. NPDC058936 TaxID=3346674 RepID=UPI00366F67D3